MKPTIGRIVVYKTTAEDKKQMQLCSEKCNVQDKLPAVIVAVKDEETVNLKVLCDGTLTIWKQNAVKGSEPGNWSWPFPIQKQ